MTTADTLITLARACSRGSGAAAIGSKGDCLMCMHTCCRYQSESTLQAVRDVWVSTLAASLPRTNLAASDQNYKHGVLSSDSILHEISSIS